MQEAELESKTRSLCPQFFSLSGKPGIMLTKQAPLFLLDSPNWNPSVTLFPPPHRGAPCWQSPVTMVEDRSLVHQLWPLMQESGAEPWLAWGSIQSGSWAQGAVCCSIPKPCEESWSSSSHWCWWEYIRSLGRMLRLRRGQWNLIPTAGVSGGQGARSAQNQGQSLHCPCPKWKLLLCHWLWAVLVLFTTISLCPDT